MDKFARAEESASINRWLANEHGWVVIKVARLDESWEEHAVPAELAEQTRLALMRANPGSMAIIMSTRPTSH